MRPFAIIVLLLALPSATDVHAAEKFDPAARARTLTPFLDEETFAVLHVDVARLAADPLFEQAAHLVPVEKQDLLLAKAGFLAAQKAFLLAGGKEIYMVVSTADISLGGNQKPPPLIVPLSGGASETALGVLFKPLGYEVCERRGDALFIGSNATWARFKNTAATAGAWPELVEAFEAAGDTAAQALFVPPRYWRRVFEEMSPTLPSAIGGGPSTVLTRGVRWAAAGLEPPPKISVRLVIQSQDPEAATALAAKWSAITGFVEKEHDVRRAFPKFREIVRLLTPEVQGNRLVLVVDHTKGVPALLALLKPSLELARADARRLAATNNLRQIGLAMINYSSVNNAYPGPASYDANGKPLLSWRVHVLPYLGCDALYKQFRLNEPWDSDHNRKLIDQMPSVYRSGAWKLKEKGRANYLVPTSKDTMFPPGSQGLKPQDIRDGASNTIMAFEVDDDHAPIWTKPEDLPLDPERPARGLAGLDEGGFRALFADGSVHILPATIEVKYLRALITPAGGDDPGKF